MDNITDGMQAVSLSGTPSSLSSSASNILANASSTCSRRPSSATSISQAASDAAVPSHKPATVEKTADTVDPASPGNLASSGSEESILDDNTQGRTRALRRQALARKISAHLRSLPASSKNSPTASSSPSRRPSSSGDDADADNDDDDDARRTYIDALATREPEVYTPALAAYFADHPEAIPERTEDSATLRRKRYDDHEVVTDRYGRATRVDARQERIFHGWDWEAGTTATAAKSGARAREDDVGPMGERERGEEVRCAHCERKGRKEEIRRVAKKGLRRLIGKKGKDERRDEREGGERLPRKVDTDVERIERVAGSKPAVTTGAR